MLLCFLDNVSTVYVASPCTPCTFILSRLIYFCLIYSPVIMVVITFDLYNYVQLVWMENIDAIVVTSVLLPNSCCLAVLTFKICCDLGTKINLIFRSYGECYSLLLWHNTTYRYVRFCFTRQGKNLGWTWLMSTQWPLS